MTVRRGRPPDKTALGRPEPLPGDSNAFPGVWPCGGEGRAIVAVGGESTGLAHRQSLASLADRDPVAELGKALLPEGWGSRRQFQ